MFCIAIVEIGFGKVPNHPKEADEQHNFDYSLTHPPIFAKPDLFGCGSLIWGGNILHLN